MLAATMPYFYYRLCNLINMPAVQVQKTLMMLAFKPVSSLWIMTMYIPALSQI